jgi:hypothetical protein
MEGYCSTGQSPQRAVVPVEEEEEGCYFKQKNIFMPKVLSALPLLPPSNKWGRIKRFYKERIKITQKNTKILRLRVTELFGVQSSEFRVQVLTFVLMKFRLFGRERLFRLAAAAVVWMDRSVFNFRVKLLLSSYTP